MALNRLLVVSTVINSRTKKEIGKSCGIIHRPNGQAFERVYKNNPREGYEIHVVVHDTFVTQKLKSLVEQGVTLINI